MVVRFVRFQYSLYCIGMVRFSYVNHLLNRTESFNGSWHKMTTRICSFHFWWRNPMTTTVYCHMPSWNIFDWLKRNSFNLMLVGNSLPAHPEWSFEQFENKNVSRTNLESGLFCRNPIWERNMLSNNFQKCLPWTYTLHQNVPFGFLIGDIRTYVAIGAHMYLC